MEFDPYYTWLGISPEEQPPNHYRLLGIREFEVSDDVIANAADRQMTYLRTVQSGRHAEISQRILNEIAAARACLLDADAKHSYDAELRARRAARSEPLSPRLAPAPPPVACGAIEPPSPPSPPPLPTNSHPAKPANGGRASPSVQHSAPARHEAKNAVASVAKLPPSVPMHAPESPPIPPPIDCGTGITSGTEIIGGTEFIGTEAEPVEHHAKPPPLPVSNNSGRRLLLLAGGAAVLAAVLLLTLGVVVGVLLDRTAEVTLDEELPPLPDATDIIAAERASMPDVGEDNSPSEAFAGANGESTLNKPAVLVGETPVEEASPSAPPSSESKPATEAPAASLPVDVAVESKAASPEPTATVAAEGEAPVRIEKTKEPSHPRKKNEPAENAKEKDMATATTTPRVEPPATPEPESPFPFRDRIASRYSGPKEPQPSGTDRRKFDSLKKKLEQQFQAVDENNRQARIESTENLLARAQQENDPTSQFAMLEQAYDQAVAVSVYPLAKQSLAEITARFEVDQLKRRIDFVSDFVRRARIPYEFQLVKKDALDLVDEAMNAGRYDEAGRPLEIAYGEAKKLADITTMDKLSKLRVEIRKQSRAGGSSKSGAATADP